MTRRRNYNGRDPRVEPDAGFAPAATREQQMAAYDRLPPAIRRAMAENADDLCAVVILKNTREWGERAMLAAFPGWAAQRSAEYEKFMVDQLSTVGCKQ